MRGGALADHRRHQGGAGRFGVGDFDLLEAGAEVVEGTAGGVDGLADFRVELVEEVVLGYADAHAVEAGAQALGQSGGTCGVGRGVGGSWPMISWSTRAAS